MWIFKTHVETKQDQTHLHSTQFRILWQDKECKQEALASTGTWEEGCLPMSGVGVGTKLRTTGQKKEKGKVNSDTFLRSQIWTVI